MGIEEAFKVLAELEEETRGRKTERAFAAGFSCLEEYEQSQTEERHRRQREDDDYIREQCVARVISRDQFLVERYQDHPEPKENSFLPSREPCDCKEHLQSTFCPKSLVLYNSQDLPEMMEYIDSKHGLNLEEFEIYDDGRSKRLDQESLKEYWTQKPERKMDIPFWANADGVVQKIIRQEANVSITPSLESRRSPSLLYHNAMSESPQAGGVMTPSTDTSSELEPPDQIFQPLCYRATPPTEISQDTLSPSHDQSHTQRGRAIKLGKRQLDATKKVAGSRVNKGQQKFRMSWKPAMGLRSRKIMLFYELGSDGNVIQHRP